MNIDFKWRHYRGEIILWAVRWQYRPRSFAGSWRVDETYIKVKGEVVLFF